MNKENEREDIKMFEGRLDYTVEGMEGTLRSLEEVQAQLKDGLHITSEINEDRLGMVDLEGFTVEQLEDRAKFMVDYLRHFEGVLDIDYDLCGDYPLELIVIFQ